MSLSTEDLVVLSAIGIKLLNLLDIYVSDGEAKDRADAMELIFRRTHIGAAIEALPEGTGVVKNSYGFSDLKRKGKPENDEWHTCGKVFLNPLEAAQTILNQEERCFNVRIRQT